MFFLVSWFILRIGQTEEMCYWEGNDKDKWLSLDFQAGLLDEKPGLKSAAQKSHIQRWMKWLQMAALSVSWCVIIGMLSGYWISYAL